MTVIVTYCQVVCIDHEMQNGAIMTKELEFDSEFRDYGQCTQVLKLRSKLMEYYDTDIAILNYWYD